MLRCSNCGGNLIFDIEKQDVACVFCKSHFAPEEYAFDKGAEETRTNAGPGPDGSDDLYESVIYTCTQCGAEITSPDNAAVAFCSFCGTEAVLESRIATQKRPVHILPFQKTKEDCRRIYTELAKASPYAPKEFQDPVFLDRFRGIYVPYWKYRVSFEGKPALKVTDRYTVGDYTYTDEYSVRPDLIHAKGDVSFDASSGFDDEISGAISPFGEEHLKSFNPAFMAGFFGDTADVDSGLYEREAAVQVQDKLLYSIRSRFKSASIDITGDSDKRREILGTKIDAVTADLYPVWFLTWRRNERLAYAVINGETGASFAEIPVDIPAFLKRSGLISVILFAAFTLLGTLFLPSTVMILTAFVACITQLICLLEVRALRSHEKNERNPGALAKTSQKNAEKMMRRMERKEKGRGHGCLIAFFIMASVVLLLVLFFAEAVAGSAIAGCFVTLLLGFVLWCAALPSALQIREKTLLMGTTLCLIAEFISMVVACIEPFEDWMFYVPSLTALLASVCTALLLIINYNRLCTRGIPNFHDRKGGARYEAG